MKIKEMSKLKRILIALMTLALCLFVFGGVVPKEAKAADVVIQGNVNGEDDSSVRYVLDSDGKLTVSGTGAMDDYPWPWGNYKDSIKHVVIGPGVTNIGDSAFQYCKNLTDVTIPNSVKTIEGFAFYDCGSLKSITIPSSMESIGEWAFARCDDLDDVTFKGNAPSIANDVFSGTTTRCYYPAGNNTWTSAVQQNYDGTVFWLESGTSLRGNCGTRLSWVLSKDNVLTISGTGAMPDYSYGEVPWYDVQKMVDSIVVKSGVTRIGDKAFDDCYNLETVSIAGSVRKIGSGAFFGCRRLNAVSLPEQLTEIGFDAFSYCESLRTIEIPAGVTSIGSWAFSSCTNLQCAAILGNVKSLGSSTFSDCVNLESVNMGVGVERIGGSAFSNCKKLKSITIPDTVTTISSRAFYNCLALKKITIPASVSSIGEQSFAECPSLETITFQGNAPNIDDEAFMNVYATVYYPSGDKTWTPEVKRDYEGMLTWEAIEFTPKRPVAAIVNVSTSGKPKITWDAVEFAQKYHVYRATSKTGSYTHLKTTTSTSFTDTSAAAGKVYYYKVRAITGSGYKSSFSTPVYIRCDLAKPVVSAENVASSGLPKLTWKAITGAEKYLVYRRSTEESSYTRIASITSVSYTDASAEAGTKYYYKIMAVHSNTAANSAKSDTVSATCDLARPTVNIKLKDGNPRLTWEKDPDAVMYYVYRATSKTGDYEHVKTTKTARSFTDTNVKAGRTYYYRVKAIHSNPAANSPYSATDSITAK